MDDAQITAAEACTQSTFSALMWAFSYPGSIQRLDASGALRGTDGLLAVAESLIDLETSFYAAAPELQASLGRLGARYAAQERAQYQFYAQFSEADLPELRRIPTGTLLAPEDSATIVIGAGLGRGYRVDLTGPGIRRKAELRVQGIPPAFWAIRQEMMRFPLGWDLFLVDDGQLAGIPRTTHVEVIEWPM